MYATFRPASKSDFLFLSLASNAAENAYSSQLRQGIHTSLQLAETTCAWQNGVPSPPQEVTAMPERNVNPAVREIEREGYRVRLDLSQQILQLSVPEDFVRQLEDGTREETIHPTLRGVRGGFAGFVSGSVSGFIPAGVLVQKAKQFDDGLYAAVEL